MKFFAVPFGSMPTREYSTIDKFVDFKDRSQASIPSFAYREKPNCVFLLSSENWRTPREIKIGPRQFEILQILCSSPLANEELAETFGVSYQTVKNEIHDLFNRFQEFVGREMVISSRESLIACAAKYGFVVYNPSSPAR